MIKYKIARISWIKSKYPKDIPFIVNSKGEIFIDSTTYKGKSIFADMTVELKRVK